MDADNGRVLDPPPGQAGAAEAASCGGCCLTSLVAGLLFGCAVWLLVSARSSAPPFWRPFKIEVGAAMLLSAAVYPVLRRASWRRAVCVAVLGVGLLLASHQTGGEYVPELLLSLGVACCVLSGLDVLLDRGLLSLERWERKNMSALMTAYSGLGMIPGEQADDYRPV
jgi:xanthosine utilization system XapX-like protein